MSALVFRQLMLKKSQKMFITEYISVRNIIINLAAVLWKQKVKQTQKKENMYCFQEQKKNSSWPWSSTECSWKKGDIFNWYSRNLNFPNILCASCQRIFSKCNEHNSWLQSKFNILSFISNNFDMKQEILLINYVLNIEKAEGLKSILRSQLVQESCIFLTQRNTKNGENKYWFILYHAYIRYSYKK